MGQVGGFFEEKVVVNLLKCAKIHHLPHISFCIALKLHYLCKSDNAPCLQRTAAVVPKQERR